MIEEEPKFFYDEEDVKKVYNFGYWYGFFTAVVAAGLATLFGVLLSQ